jgi:hypothetical protein
LALPIIELGDDSDKRFGAAWLLEVEGRYHADGMVKHKIDTLTSTGLVIAMIITFIVILPLFWMCFGLPDKVKSIWRGISPSVWQPASDKNEHQGSDDRKKKGDESRQPSVKLCPRVRPRLEKRQPNKTQSDLENGTAGVGGASSPE